MNLPKPVSLLICFSCFALLQSCGGATTQEDFMGNYHIDKYVPAAPSPGAPDMIQKTSDWTISLEAKNNFLLSGTGKHVVGYWNIQKADDKAYSLLLQGGGYTIYGRLDGKSILFDGTYKVFDSLFSQVTFIKTE